MRQNESEIFFKPWGNHLWPLKPHVWTIIGTVQINFFPIWAPLKQCGPPSKATPKNGFNGVLRGWRIVFWFGTKKRSSENCWGELKIFLRFETKKNIPRTFWKGVEVFSKARPLKKFLNPPLVAWPNDSAERHQHIQSVMNIAAAQAIWSKNGIKDWRLSILMKKSLKYFSY